MEVKRTKTDLGFIRYVVSNSDHIRVKAPYEAGSRSSFWLIEIPDLSRPTLQGGYNRTTIYCARTLNELKEVLGRFSTEEELLGAYYKSRLEGKFQLY